MNLSTIKRKGAALTGLLALCIFLITPFVIATHHHAEELVGHCAICILSSVAFVSAAPPQASTLNPEESDGPQLESDTVVALDVRMERPARASPAA